MYLNVMKKRDYPHYTHDNEFPTRVSNPGAKNNRSFIF